MSDDNDKTLNEADKLIFEEFCVMHGGQFPRQISREVMDQIAMRLGISVTKPRKVVARMRETLRPEEPQVTASVLEASWRKVVK